MDCPLHHYISSSCSLIWLEVNLTWSEMATPALFCLPFLGVSFPIHSLWAYVSLQSRDESGKQDVVGSCFSIHPANLCLLIGKFNPLIFSMITDKWGSPGGSVGKEFTCNGEDPCSISGSGRSPRGGNGNPLQYSHLESPIDRGAWQATIHEVATSWDTTEWPNTFTFSPINEDLAILSLVFWLFYTYISIVPAWHLSWWFTVMFFLASSSITFHVSRLTFCGLPLDLYKTSHR